MEIAHKASGIKRLFLFNIKHFSYLSKALVIIILVVVVFFLRDTIADVLLKLDIKKDDNLGIEIVGIFLGFLIAESIDLFRISSVQRWACQWLIRVNTTISSQHHIQLHNYDDTISSRIRDLLPEELKDAWLRSTLGNKYIIPLRAEELISPGLKNTRPGHIKNLLLFLDLEFFANSDERLPPITIQGEPGSGKSTLIFELYRQHAGRLKGQNQGWIPVIIFAHELSWDLLRNQSSLKNLLVEYFKRSFSKYDRRDGYESIMRFLQEHYDRYQFLIIIDGLDEITNRQLYEDMTKKLNELLEKEWRGGDSRSNVNRYIVTCRTDDNQRIITSRLISLLTLDYSETTKYLQGLSKVYKKKRDLPNRQRVENIIAGLETSRADRLLQNYVSNPYLLSIILKHYEEKETSQARTLRKVFENVLERELRKARRNEFEKEERQDVRAELRPYLSSLLAPYCYRLTMDTLHDGRLPKRNFRVYIEEDLVLSEILFGGQNSIGYLQSVAQDNVQARENGILALAKLWGDVKAQEFREHLDNLNSRSIPYDDFAARAIQYLHDDVLNLLEDLRLAEIDERNGSIKRFRHRRMQDYFMALFIDKVGMTVEGQPRILLDNAWMKEPVRILAAISSRPEDLLSSFTKEYENYNTHDQSKGDADQIRNVELLLNASEAIAYLPRPQTPKYDQLLYKLVIELGIKAQDLYYKIASRVKKNNVQSARKCLTILRNIYASEFLRNDSNIFNVSQHRDDKRSGANFWKQLHRDVQYSPGFYQHIAYLYLYPIRRAQKEFPISRLSLLFYVIDAIFCFPDAYHRLIRETHPKPLGRGPLKFGFLFEKILALSVIGLLLYIPWHLDDIFPSWEFKLIATGILACICAILALASHWFGLMEWAEFYHIVTWIPLKTYKWLWPKVKYLITNLLEALKELTRYIVRKACRVFKWVIKHPVPAILILIALVVSKPIASFIDSYLIPRVEYAYGEWQYKSATEQFIQEAKEYTASQEEPLKQTNEFIKQSNEFSSDKRNQIMTLLNERKSIAANLINRGQYLIETSKSYPQAESMHIHDMIRQLIMERDNLAGLETQIINREESIRYAVRLVSFRKNVEATNEAVNKLVSLQPATSSVPEMQSDLDKTNDGIASADALLKEGESLASDRDYKENLAPEIERIKGIMESLKQRASWVSGEIKRISAIEPIVDNNLAVDKLRAILVQRSKQALDRTILTDLQGNISAVENYNKTALSILPQIESDIHMPYRKFQVFSKFGQMQDYLDYINGMDALISDIPLMQQQLDEHNSEISSIIDDSKNLPQFEDWKSQLEARSASVKAVQERLGKFDSIHQKYSESHIKDDLTRAHKEISEQLFSMLFLSVLIIVFVALILLIIALYRRFIRDKKGEREVEMIKEDFGSLLLFIGSNGYSFRVNSRAIAYLKQLEPQDRERWRKISEVAWRRHNMPGDKNEKIGRSLDEVAVGIDTILNHQLPS